MMKFRVCGLLISVCVSFYCNMYVQCANFENYHRSSLYSIILKHPEQQFAKEIVDAFKEIPIPERYNNHNLKFTVMKAPIIKKITKEELEGAYKDAIFDMLIRNKIGGRLVEKWFNRDAKSGTFNMDLVRERGYYDASISDIETALRSARGLAMLEDAGEELLSHTYVLVNDVRYADKTAQRNLQGFAAMAGLFASVFVPGSASLSSELFKSAIYLNDKVVGFKVFVTSYLFKLEWNKDVANNFFSNMWVDSDSPNMWRCSEFKNKMSDFKIKYLGCTTVYSGETSLAGVEYETDMFRKVCTRSIDKAISELQNQFDEFKIFSPLVSVDPLMSYVGVKEGVVENSSYEVLEVSQDENGRTCYTRKAVIKPIKGKIWDNRYLADREEGFDSSIKGTFFDLVSGGDLYPGMLIREIGVESKK